MRTRWIFGRVDSGWRAVTKIPDVRRFLLGSLFVGVGQQSVLILRNPFLVDRGWSPDEIPALHGWGAVAGVMAGLVGLMVAGKARPAFLLIAGGVAQGVGFCIQSLAKSHGTVLLGAVIAGVPIQLYPAIAAPFLTHATEERHRLSSFAWYATALYPLAGLGAYGTVVLVTRLLGEGLIGEQYALLTAALCSVMAVLPFARIAQPVPTVAPAWRLKAPRRLLPCIAVEAILGIGAGISIPFMQLFFKVTFGMGPQTIAGVYLSSMIAGVIGYSVGPSLARRFGIWQTIVATGLMSLPFLAELAITTKLAAAAAAFVARNTLMNMSSPLVQSFYQEVAEEGDGPVLAALAVLVRSSFWALGNFAAGPLLAAGAGRFNLAFTATAALYAIGSLASAAAYPRMWRTRPPSRRYALSGTGAR